MGMDPSVVVTPFGRTMLLLATNGGLVMRPGFVNKARHQPVLAGVSSGVSTLMLVGQYGLCSMAGVSRPEPMFVHLGSRQSTTLTGFSGGNQYWISDPLRLSSFATPDRIHLPRAQGARIFRRLVEPHGVVQLPQRVVVDSAFEESR
ncbi:hypothetical protein [Nocardia sp. NPDC052566]|uniref:hypothetical protein n=1 Tax=Nocardia sp. NPDC052566 TaxID=3364330 RepID=UPI0037C76E37